MKYKGGSKLYSLGPKLALLTATVIWGSSFVIVKSTVDIVPPNFLLALRFSGSALLMALLFFRRWRLFNLGYLWRGALMGAFLYGAYCLQTLGIQSTTPGKNAFLTAVYCILVPFVYWLVNRTRPNVFQFSGAVLCMAGIGLVSLRGDFSVGTGDLLTLAGGCFYAFHMVTVAKASRDRDIFLLTALQFAFSGLFAWVGTLCFEPFPERIPPEAWWGIAYLVIFCTAIALLLQNLGQKYTPPSLAAILMSFESVFGAAFSVLLGQDALSVRLVLGFCLIFAAVLLSEAGSAKLDR